MNRARSLAILGILSFVTSPAAAAEVVPAYGAEANPTGDPIGGGDGYRRIVERGDFNVATAGELLAALKEARTGQTIYVAHDARIDLTGQMGLQLLAGVTLPPECRPRIRFQQPPLPADPPPKVRGEVRPEIEVSVYGPLQHQSVVVQLDQKQSWSGQQGPPPGEITLNTRELTNGEHKLTVTATDTRGVSSQHSAYLAVEN